MRAFIVLAATLAVANAGLIAGPVAVGAHATQYHSQDELGQYSYGYAGGPSAKSETKTADGVVRGAYSYIDGHGLVQHANYIADPVNGFRVAATNLPVGPVAPAAPVLAAAPIAPVARAIAAPIAPVARAIAAPLAHHAIATPAIAHHAHLGVPALAHHYAAPLLAQPTYHAHAAPLNNGAVHIAPLPLPPADTPEVMAARAAHFAAKLG